MRALNFYSIIYHGNLVTREKRCTIRLGDKRGKYAEGDLVWVTSGDRFARRTKLYTAVIDRVVTKPARELSPEDVAGESRDMKGVDDVLAFLAKVYGRPVSVDELVTVVYFSEVVE